MGMALQSQQTIEGVVAEQLQVESSDVGLMVNEEKTQYMKMCRDVENGITPIESNELQSYIDCFKYLAVTSVSSYREESEIKNTEKLTDVIGA